MSLLILQNADFEGPGLLLDWAGERKLSFRVVRAWEEALPAETDFTHLVILGSPLSVSDIERLPWLKNEAAFAERFILAGKPTLGICLGAQILSHLLGGKISLNEQAEIGWHTLRECGELSGHSLFQWHREIFSLPPEATPFGRTAATPLQGFWRGERVLALGSHPEITTELVNVYLERCWSEESVRAERAAGKGDFIQSREEIVNRAPLEIERSRAAIYSLLHRWADAKSDC